MTRRGKVQIPLWAMVTANLRITLPMLACSDSSMGDGNWVLEAEANIEECSDSSMGDGNQALACRQEKLLKFRFLYGRW